MLRFVTTDGRTIPRGGYRVEDFVDDDIGGQDASRDASRDTGADASHDAICTTTA